MAARLKIGVLTFHRCINYGSYWQARALVEGLRALGHDAELLDHHCRRVTWAEWRCAFQPTLPHPTPRSDFQGYAAKARRFLEAFRVLPQSRRFALEDPSPLKHYDVIVIGSDEVWNLAHPWYGGKPLFYGAGLKAERLVSYAASFGNYSCHWGIDARWAERLKAFDRLSVRDENSYWLVRGSTGVEPQIVLDPVLQFPRASEDDGRIRSQPYLLLYGHGFPDWYARAVRRAADRDGLRLVSIGYRNDFADEQWLGAGPIDFARSMAGASAIATNFFHGCVFALARGKPFAAVSTPYRHNKLRDLTTALAASHHLVDEDTAAGEIEQLLRAPLAPQIGENIARLRSASSRYLHAALAA